MFGKNFKRKYALTEKGVQNVKKGTFWTVIVNIVVMGGVSVLYLLMKELMAVLTGDQTEINMITILNFISCICILIIYNASSAVYSHLWTCLWGSQGYKNCIGGKTSSITIRIF